MAYENQFFLLHMLMKWLMCKMYIWEVAGTLLAGYETSLTGSFYGFFQALQV
jgi:hypothetical protein